MKKNNFRPSFFKVCQIACLVFCMIVGPQSFAQGRTPPNATAAQLGSLIQQGTVAAIGGMMQGMPQAPVNVQTVDSRIFPGRCRVLPAQTSMPVGACEGELPVGGGGMMGQIAAMQASAQAQQMLSMANGMYSSIEALINPDSNDPATPMGQACLERERKRLSDQFTLKIQELQALIGRIDANNAVFIEQNSARLSAMADNAFLLYGTNFQDKANQAHLKLKDSFSNECQNTIGLDVLQQSAGSGLEGLNTVALTPAAQSASNYQTNRNDYDRQIKEQIDKMKKDLKEFGISSVNANSANFADGGQNFSGIKEVWDREFAQFDRKYQSYNQLMMDYTNQPMPQMNHAFETEIERMTQVLTQNFRREFINNCVTGADQTGVALSRDQILSSLVHTTTNNRGSAITSYRTQLESILNSDLSMEQKVEEIRLLDLRAGNAVQLEVEFFTGSNTPITPYQLYQQTLQLCEDRLAQPRQDGSLSVQERIDEAQKLVDDLKKDKDRFIRNIDNKILDEVINCSGRPLAAGSCTITGAQGMLDPGGANFCLTHADSCSTNINACKKEADDVIKVKKDHTAILAQEYNQNFLNLIALQNQTAAAVQAEILGLASLVNQMIPGTAWELQSDALAITPPLPTLVGDLGVHLRGAGGFESLEQLKERVRGLQETLGRQKALVDGEVQEYIGEQIANMEEAKKEWQELADKCSDQIAQAQQRQQEQMAQQQQMANEANQFCNDYIRATSQPTCGNVSALAGATLQSAGGLVGAQQRNAQAIEEDFCNDQVREEDNSRSVASEAPSERRSVESLSTSCGNDNDFSRVRSGALSRFRDIIPSDLQAQETTIINYIEGTVPELPAEIRNDDFFSSHIEPLRKSLREAGDTDITAAFGADADEETRAAIEFLARHESELEGENLGSIHGHLETLMGSSDLSNRVNSNYCVQMRLEMLVDAYNREGDDPNINRVLERYEEAIQGEEGTNDDVEKVAQGITNVFERDPRSARLAQAGITGSDSLRMGQRLNNVPCTAVSGGQQQGARNPFALQQDRILGPGNSGGLITTGVGQ